MHRRSVHCCSRRSGRPSRHASTLAMAPPLPVHGNLTLATERRLLQWLALATQSAAAHRHRHQRAVGTLRGCWPVQNDTQKCSACEVRQQNHLHAAGCTEADIEAYCGVLTDDAFTDAWFLLDAKYVTARTHRLRFSASLLECKVAFINY